MITLIAILFGLYAGWKWETFVTKPRGKNQALLTSVRFSFGKKIIHIHHWLYYLFALIVSAYTILIERGMWVSFSLFIFMFSFAAMAYNFRRYPDWYKFIYSNKEK